MHVDEGKEQKGMLGVDEAEVVVEGSLGGTITPSTTETIRCD